MAEPPHGANVAEDALKTGKTYVTKQGDTWRKGKYSETYHTGEIVFGGLLPWDGRNWEGKTIVLHTFKPGAGEFYEVSPEGGRRRRGKKKTRKGTRKSRRTTRRNRFT